MPQRYHFAHFILVSVVVLSLTPLVVVVDAEAQIVFASNRHGAGGEIYVMDPDGGNQRRLTNNVGDNDNWPSWSPDGKHIVFFAAGEIAVMDADGGNKRILTNNDRNSTTWEPSWSPDGRWIVCSSEKFNEFTEIHVMDADGKNRRNLTGNAAYNADPSWLPDGKRIVFASGRDGNGEIYVMDADGKNPRNLTQNATHEADPSWSPDGKRIVFTSIRDGHVDAEWGLPTSEIYVMDADGKNQRRLTNNPHDDYSPSWSPDGRRIVFTSRRDGNGEIYVMDADGSNLRNLTNHPDDDYHPAWFRHTSGVAPAGKTLTMWARVKQIER